MPYRIAGTLKLPNGVVATGVDVKFRALKSYSPLVEQAETTIRTDAAGKYDVSLEFNTYVCEITFSTNRPFNAGQFTVAVDTVAGQDLPTLLQQSGWTPATPEWIAQIQGWLAAANLAAQKAEESSDSAKISATNSKRSEDEVEADRAEVALNATDVSTKHAEVLTKTLQVAQDASATLAAKTIAVQAADTASQKAQSAAIHDASSKEAATRAENAASAMIGAILDGGECDLSGGAYPQPLTVNGKQYSTVWYVAVSGNVSGIAYDVGDVVRYTTANNGYYFKVDAKDDVYSVNGDKGAVVITPEKIGAEVAGAAQQLVDQHASKPGAHGISGVHGLTEALAGKEVAGAAASAITEHEAKSGAHSISGVTGLRNELDNIKTTGEVAIKDVADKLDGVQSKISQLEQYPKVINMSDIFDGTSVWSAPNGDFSVIEHEDYYHIQGIFRTISGSGAGGTLGNFKRNIKLSYAPCVVSESPSTVSTYPYIERGWTGGAYGKAINLVTAFKNSTWVMVNFIVIKEQQ